MKVIAVIPARYHSSRFEGKALADIQGKPMIEWVYRQAVKSLLVNKTIVATDDERIFRVVTKFGGDAVMTSADSKTGTDRIAESVKNIRTDLVVNVQGDEPLISPEVIDSVVQPLLDNSKLQMA
ncbi:MAG: NTP transferase domain-containing protein, partial [Nitrospinota bacterium]|nr:NTP transferase domain-containing protein [Nitrospinota bacterium]